MADFRDSGEGLIRGFSRDPAGSTIVSYGSDGAGSIRPVGLGESLTIWLMVADPMLNPSAFPDFATAATAVLQFLRSRLAFDLWMVTRTEGDDWIVLQAEDHGYGVKPGQVFQWADSFCWRMVAGQGPNVAPCSQSIPAYAAAPIAQRLQIGAYIGLPLTRADGSLFGTLCAIHPTAFPEAVLNEQPLIELATRLLATILEAELTNQEALRIAEQASLDADTDTLTGLANRRGWDRLLQAEEDRCRRYGHVACILAIDLDGLKSVNDQQGHAAGDEVIRKAAHAIRGSVRSADVVARIGGDEFVVLAVETDRLGGMILADRLWQQLAQVGVAASIGVAARHAHQGLVEACQAADDEMYQRKRARKGNPGPPEPEPEPMVAAG